MEILDLVKKAKKGDKEALINLVMDKKDEYFRLAYVFMGNKEDSLDALQDMIVILFDNIRKLKDPNSFYSWSKTILVNLCKTALKRKNKVVLLDIPEDKEFDENYNVREIKQDILANIKKLNIYQQEAISLRYFMDMDYETISKITATPEGTVKSRIHNGLVKLKELFGGEY